MKWHSLILLLVINYAQAQDFMSLIAPFLGSGLGSAGGAGGGLGGLGGGAGGGSPGGGGIAALLSGIGNNNAGPGSNLPFGDLFNLGAGLLNKQPPQTPAPTQKPWKPNGNHGGNHGGNRGNRGRGANQGPHIPQPAPGVPPVPDASDYDEPLAKANRQRYTDVEDHLIPSSDLSKYKVDKAKHKPAAPKPPDTLTWLEENSDYYDDNIDLRLTGAKAVPRNPRRVASAGPSVIAENIDAPQAIGRRPRRSVPNAPNPIYHRPNARTWVRNDATGPPIGQHIQPVVYPQQQQQQFVAQDAPSMYMYQQQQGAPALPYSMAPVAPVQYAPIQPFVVQHAPPPAPTPAVFPTFPTFFPTLPPPTIAAPHLPGPTLAPYVPKGDNKLLAHNAASMIREIVSFSDSHRGQHDYSAVQSLMEHFFEAMAPPNQVSSVGAPAFDSPQLLSPQYDGTELGANRPLTNKLFESDMVLTMDQMQGVIMAAEQVRRGGLRRGKRKVITGSVYRWPKGPIPYRFKGGDDKWKKLIQSALNHWESETCVRWKENAAGKDYVVFFRGGGCYSSVGRTGGSQLISIGYGCEDKGIVTHEVGHSLGFWHEQSRPDRDDYIYIKKDWIIKGTNGNFERRTKDEIEDMGLPYDLGSVMHYGPSAFTKDWDEITIQTRDKNYQRTIGQRVQPSFIDVKQVNRLYCNDVCPKNALKCRNGGYPDPNNCRRCKCPPGLGGIHCDAVPQSEGACGGDLLAAPMWQELAHRGKKRCYWRIKTDNARIKFILSNVTYRCESTCKAYVEIKHNSDFQQTGFRVCCPEQEYTVTSDQSEILIFTDPTILDYETGFTIRFIKDSGLPLPKPPPPNWVPGQENRGFRGQTGGGSGGSGGSGGVDTVEKFILNIVPKIRDAHRPLESIASIVTEYSLASLLGIRNKK